MRSGCAKIGRWDSSGFAFQINTHARQTSARLQKAHFGKWK